MSKSDVRKEMAQVVADIKDRIDTAYLESPAVNPQPSRALIESIKKMILSQEVLDHPDLRSYMTEGGRAKEPLADQPGMGETEMAELEVEKTIFIVAVIGRAVQSHREDQENRQIDANKGRIGPGGR